MDWTRFLKRAASLGGERQLLLALRLTRDVLGQNDLPGPAVDRLRHATELDPLVSEVRERLFMPVEQRTFQGSFGLVRGAVFYVRSRERLRDRIPYALHVAGESLAIVGELVRPNYLDHAVVELPRPLGFLYYGVRAARVTRKGLAWLLSAGQRRGLPHREGAPIANRNTITGQ